ncbi:bola-like protein [Martensiomyces pterosporus]|nr:bola-like protein [Martensiomyces pterosporus]
MVSAEQVREKLISQLPASHVEVLDVSGGCGSMFQAIVVSDEFEGKSRLQRQRLVNAVLKDEMATIHAFSQVSSSGK